MPASVSVLQLVKRKDADNSDINSVDLMSLPIELQYEGWQQATPAQQGQPSVDDVITLLMNAGDDNALAAALQSIDTKVKEVQWAQDPLNPIGVWLRSRLSTETNARQAFILAARRSPALQVTDPLAYDSILQKYQLGITRTPVWENVLASMVGGSAVSAHGGMVSYTVAGDAHARIAQTALYGTAAYTEAWLGVKSNRYGVNPANFVSLWPLSDNSFLTTPDTTNVAEATAINGTERKCTFATTATMAYRALVPISAITANVTDQRGKYIVLLRARRDAGLACNVRVGYGYRLNTTTALSMAFKPRVSIIDTGTFWKYYTLGTVSIPATAGFFDLAFGAFSLAIQAEKISGTGNLELDSLVLIPAEHCVHTAATFLGFQTIGVATEYIFMRPDQKIYAVAFGLSNTTVIEAPRVDSIAWSIPAGTGKIVVCGSADIYPVTSSDTITPTFTVYPSYSSLRGSA